MISRDTIQKRIQSLGKGGTTFFSRAELNNYGMTVGREDYNGGDGPLYRLYQCGDPLGQYNLFGAVDQVERQKR